MECKDCTIDFNANPSKPRSSNAGLIVAGIAGGSALLLSAICFPFVTPALRKYCLPYVPATNAQVSNVLKALKGRKGSLIDLGSGDGRIVIAAAKQGFKSVGVELNPWLVWYSRFKSFTSGTSSCTKFIKRDLWKVPLNDYKNVVIFGVDTMMEDLEKKCKQELERDSAIVACRFPLPTTLCSTSIGEGIDTVWLYDGTFKRKPVDSGSPNSTL